MAMDYNYLMFLFLRRLEPDYQEYRMSYAMSHDPWDEANVRYPVDQAIEELRDSQAQRF